jgi:hypothetical protein
MSIPDEFRCPITMEVMTDPVIGEDGQTYERSAIEAALRVKAVSPMTRQPMTAASLRSNYALKAMIQRWQEPKTKKTSAPPPSAPALTHTHTEYVLLITPEVQREQERLLTKQQLPQPRVENEVRRRTCGVAVIAALFIIIVVFVFHAMASSS